MEIVLSDFFTKNETIRFSGFERIIIPSCGVTMGYIARSVTYFTG